MLGTGGTPNPPKKKVVVPRRSETPPLLDVEHSDPPAPRRGHLFTLFTPKATAARTNSAISDPVVLCFGGSLLPTGPGSPPRAGLAGADSQAHGGPVHFAGAECFFFDPTCASDAYALDHAPPGKVASLFDASVVGSSVSRLRRLSDVAGARAGTPVGARAERAFIDTIRSDLATTSAHHATDYSYDGVKKLLQTANRERLKLKPSPGGGGGGGDAQHAGRDADTHSIASSSASVKVVHTMMNHDHTALTNMQHDIHDVQSTVKMGKNAFQRSHDASLSHSNSLSSLPNLKNLPVSFKQIHSSCSAQDLERIKSINARTHNKAIARKLWYEHAEPHPLAHLLPPELQVWL